MTSRRIATLVGAVALVLLAVLALERQGRNLLRSELQVRARGIAELLAGQLAPEDLASVMRSEDMKSGAFLRIVEELRRTKRANPEVRYIYAIRPDFDRGPNWWRFIVDADPVDEDRDGDGKISADEVGSPPGMEYDAESSPAMIDALREPSFDPDFKEDAWGVLMSGYAPVLDDSNPSFRAIIGVDMPGSLISERLFWLRLSGAIVFLLVGSLVVAALLAYFSKADALGKIEALDEELRVRNLSLGEANVRLETTVAALEERERVMAEEIALARKVQERMLPREFPFSHRLRFAALYRACSTVGGDLYDVFPLGPKCAGFVIADVSGHGVSAALVTAILKVSIERYLPVVQQAVRRDTGPAAPVDMAAVERAVTRFFADLNRSLHGSIPDNSFATMQMGILNVDTGDLLVANAGHLPPVLVCASSPVTAELLSIPPNLPVGIIPDLDMKVASFKLPLGGKVIFYTDGIVELMDRDEELYGMERLARTVQNWGGEDPDHLLERILADTRVFAGELPPDDDQAILVVEYREGPGADEVSPETMVPTHISG